MLETVPGGIGDLSKLAILKLDQNRLHTLNENVGRLVHCSVPFNILHFVSLYSAIYISYDSVSMFQVYKSTRAYINGEFLNGTA